MIRSTIAVIRSTIAVALLASAFIGANDASGGTARVDTTGVAASAQASATILRPAQVFDGETLHDDWIVVVEGSRITGAGPASEIVTPASAESVDLPGLTLLPGLIEGHSHILLHPYNETPWTDGPNKCCTSRSASAPRERSITCGTR